MVYKGELYWGWCLGSGTYQRWRSKDTGALEDTASSPAPARQAAVWHAARGLCACAQGGQSSAERRKRSAAILPRAEPLRYTGTRGCTGA